MGEEAELFVEAQLRQFKENPDMFDAMMNLETKEGRERRIE